MRQIASTPEEARSSFEESYVRDVYSNAENIETVLQGHEQMHDELSSRIDSNIDDLRVDLETLSNKELLDYAKNSQEKLLNFYSKAMENNDKTYEKNYDDISMTQSIENTDLQELQDKINALNNRGLSDLIRTDVRKVTQPIVKACRERIDAAVQASSRFYNDLKTTIKNVHKEISITIKNTVDALNEISQAYKENLQIDTLSTEVQDFMKMPYEEKREFLNNHFDNRKENLTKKAYQNLDAASEQSGLNKVLRNHAANSYDNKITNLSQKQTVYNKIFDMEEKLIQTKDNFKQAVSNTCTKAKDSVTNAVKDAGAKAVSKAVNVLQNATKKAEAFLEKIDADYAKKATADFAKDKETTLDKEESDIDLD